MSFTLAELLRRKPDVLNAVDRCVTDKTVYYSKADAQTAAKALNNARFRHGSPVKSFRCDWCPLASRTPTISLTDGWRLTHD